MPYPPVPTQAYWNCNCIITLSNYLILTKHSKPFFYISYVIFKHPLCHKSPSDRSLTWNKKLQLYWNRLIYLFVDLTFPGITGESRLLEQMFWKWYCPCCSPRAVTVVLSKAWSAGHVSCNTARSSNWSSNRCLRFKTSGESVYGIHISLGKWPTWCTITLYNAFIITILYMFRASLCSSSGGQIVLMQHLV